MESDGVTLVEPSAVTVPTSGAMVSCVALVEDQLNVDESPLLMDVGSAESVTVGCAGAGAGAGAGGGVVATGFFLQPPVKMVATRPATIRARYNGRETTVILFPPQTYLEYPCSTHREAIS